MTNTRLTKQQAAEHFGVSVTTLDRMIRRGELQIERDGPGERAKVWILLDEEEGLSDGLPNGQQGRSRDELRDVEMEVLREKVKNLEELSDYHKQQLKDAEWRYQQILQELSSSHRTVETLTRALPAASEPPTEQRKRGWWPFRRGPRQ